MNYVGLDIHKKHIQVQHMTSDGTLGLKSRIATSEAALLSVLDELEGPLSVSLEAGRNHWWISQLLLSQAKVSKLQVVDPRRSRNLAQELSVQKGYGRAKNDRIDAEMLSEIDRLGVSPVIHLASAAELELRSLCRHRFMLVGLSRSLSNRIQAILAMHGIRSTTRALLDDPELSSLDHLQGYIPHMIGQFLDQIRLINKQLESTERRLNKCLPEKDPSIKLLLTTPGIGIVTARIIMSEIFSISYFESPKYLISYSGLAPVEDESAGRKGIIKLNKHCNYFLKYAFVIAAHTARRHPKYKAKYNRDVRKHGKIRAKTNLARRIAKAVFWMLTRQQPFK